MPSPGRANVDGLAAHSGGIGMPLNTGLNRGIVRVGIVAALLAGVLVMAAPNAFAAPTWSVVPTPDPAANSAFLQGVACPATTTCVAVGYTGGAFTSAHLLTEQW